MIKRWKNSIACKRVALNLRNGSKPNFISCNVQSLPKHYSDISKASGVQEAEIVCIQETWLNPSTNVNNFLEDKGFEQHNNSVGRGKGISTFYKSDYTVEKDVTKPNYQMTKLKLVKYPSHIDGGQIDLVFHY